MNFLVESLHVVEQLCGACGGGFPGMENKSFVELLLLNCYSYGFSP